ncbi:serine/threonine-protein kinase PLK1-like [Acanthaster planci]|uniref:Serine/threonine-protein kinase PLK n=1 Tax=Acanthaster planci TaxID=133434 RepID=A0A8B7YN46_ACAPL|nr:serine/threonine-protein kinase PLK1-like [Acanthaster planci]
MSARPREDLRVKDACIPDFVVDPRSGKKYKKGRFLGKGGFAKCYELIDVATNTTYAGKIVSKNLLVKPHQKEKMSMEIAIHRSVSHKHIVGFHGFFEDTDNVYILLELCRRRSLMELHKRRRAITEPETRYFMRHAVLAMQYLHKNQIIHRDLKLGNLFLDDEMDLKLGDFGLATRIEKEGERKRTLCGTPNYIAPEVLAKKGHSYEVDIWSLGCIMFTLLVGKPPFETSCLKDTYLRIKRNEYSIPSSCKVSPAARSLISRLLKNNPHERPSVDSLLEDTFFTSDYLPPKLPTTCLTVTPRFAPLVTRKPLKEINAKDENASPTKAGMDLLHKGTLPKPFQGQSENQASGRDQAVSIPTARVQSAKTEEECSYLTDLLSQLVSVVHCKPAEVVDMRMDDAEDPAAAPVLWISKWVDYSDKYGLGYQLSDGSFGVLFNDSTKLLLQSNGEDMEYIERDGTEKFFSIDSFSESMRKKVTLLKYFRNYMSEHLLKTGAAVKLESDNLARLPFLRTWFRTRSAIVLHLNNGTLQINFFQDHTKIILCPLMAAVTYIDETRQFRTYRLSLIEKCGCCRELASRLQYARIMTERLLAPKTHSAKPHKETTSAVNTKEGALQTIR